MLRIRSISSHGKPLQWPISAWRSSSKSGFPKLWLPNHPFIAGFPMNLPFGDSPFMKTYENLQIYFHMKQRTCQGLAPWPRSPPLQLKQRSNDDPLSGLRPLLHPEPARCDRQVLGMTNTIDGKCITGWAMSGHSAQQCRHISSSSSSSSSSSQEEKNKT